MTAIKGTGKIINTKCTETAIHEFPEMLFGTLTDGIRVFDATHYLNTKYSKAGLTVEDFFNKFDFQINAIAEVYNIPLNDLVHINTEGHQLIDGCLCYPFISYTDPQFCAYMNELVEEVFVNGFTVSDTFALQFAQKRLTQSLLKQLIDDHGKTDS